MRASRTAIVLFGCAIAWVMGVRVPRAAQFDTIAFAGKGRATLVIEETTAAAPEAAGTREDEARFGLVEVFARLTFGTRISAFSKGLYARSSFSLPRTGETAVLVVDVDRAGGAREWRAGDDGLRARLYTVAEGSQARFDAEPVSGSLELEAAIVGRNAAGFRIRGWLEMRDPGPDGVRDTDDDVALEVDVTLESIPSPEEIAGQPALPPRRPQGGFCELPWCWADDGYYDGYSYGYGCGDAEIGYDTTSDGCEGDTIQDAEGGSVDGGGAIGQPGTDDVVAGDGCAGDSSAQDDPGCEGSDGGSSNDGCDGGDAGAGGCDDSGGDTSGGCSDSGGASGCGSSGCEGDTLQRTDPQGDQFDVPDRDGAMQAGVDLAGIGLFASALATWLASARRRGRSGASEDC